MHNRYSVQDHSCTTPLPSTPRTCARSLLILSAALILPILGSGDILHHQKTDDLLGLATRFTDQRAWRSPDYFWVPPTSLIHVVAPVKGDWYLAKKRGPTLPEARVPGITGSALHAKAVALEAPPAGESMLEQAPIIPDRNVVPDLSLSPDGKWLVCPRTVHDDTKLLLAEIRTQKRHVCSGSYNEWGPGYLWPTWMPDSSAWVTVMATTERAVLQIRSVHAPDRVRTVHIRGDIGNNLLGITAGGRLLSTSFGDRDGSFVFLKSCDLTGSSRAAQTIKVSLPKGQRFGDFALSSRGDRLIWITMAAPTVEGSTISDEARQNSNSRTLPAFTFWVSRADGSGWTRVGSIADQKEAPSTPRWLPDGAHVSFILGKSLWTIPIDVAPR